MFLPYSKYVCAGVVFFLAAIAVRAQVQVTVEQHSADTYPAFRFSKVPPPQAHDAAVDAAISVVDGTADPHCGGLSVLKDGITPVRADQPNLNFFFAPGSNGGRLQFDLHRRVNIQNVNTYSWHSSSRAPQIYTLYGSDGLGANFNPEPKRPVDPSRVGWRMLGKVDTRKTNGAVGGAYGVSIHDPSQPVGHYRYLLFDIEAAETRDSIGNTFYSEIDVIETGQPLADEVALPGLTSYSIEGANIISRWMFLKRPNWPSGPGNN
ncbi:hypothetical protein [Granulicella mallensis]|uniref:hypothetical protein n=1 Tax=Granulicella mallensis TaxID=940614 RepID=UPI0001DA0363|nr:hypothetical protein [Granulicella mallensis]